MLWSCPGLFLPAGPAGGKHLPDHTNGEMTYLSGWHHMLGCVTRISLGHRAQLRAHPRRQATGKYKVLGIEGTRVVAFQRLIWDWGTGLAGSWTSPYSSRILPSSPQKLSLAHFLTLSREDI